jgi:hypothetical protein
MEEATAAHPTSHRQSATTRVWGSIGSAEIFAEGTAHTATKWDVHRAGRMVRYGQGRKDRAASTGEAMGIKLQGVGGGGTGDPIKLQGFAGSHTRPARPPEAKAKLRRTAGGLRFFWGELR